MPGLVASSSQVGRSRFESDLQQLLQRYNLSALNTSGRSVSGQDGSQLHRLNFTSSYGQRVSVNDSSGFRQGPMKWQNHTYAWAKNESEAKEATGGGGHHHQPTYPVDDNEIDEHEPDDYRSHRFLIPPTPMDNRNPLQLFGMISSVGRDRARELRSGGGFQRGISFSLQKNFSAFKLFFGFK